MLLDALISPAPQYRTGTSAVDRLIGLAGADRLIGLGEADANAGGPGRDFVDGGTGDDLILTLGDGDRLCGGAGTDMLTGGLSDDFFDFVSLAEAQTGVDLIVDFNDATGNNDAIRISTAFAAGLVAGVVPQGRFVAHDSNIALDANDRFIFCITDRT